MWHEFDHWEDFPIASATLLPRRPRHGLDEVANRCAEWVLEVVIAGAPVFYAVFFLAYVAVEFGILGTH